VKYSVESPMRRPDQRPIMMHPKAYIGVVA
jgi:hypothetical protein